MLTLHFNYQFKDFIDKFLLLLPMILILFHTFLVIVFKQLNWLIFNYFLLMIIFMYDSFLRKVIAAFILIRIYYLLCFSELQKLYFRFDFFKIIN